MADFLSLLLTFSLDFSESNMDQAVFETLSKIFDADTNIRGNAEQQLQTLQGSPGKNILADETTGDERAVTDRCLVCIDSCQ